MYRRQPLKFLLKTCNSRFPVDIPLDQWRFSKALVGFLGVLCFLFTHDGACISRKLPTHELSIDTSIRHQFIMGALLHNEALVNYTNLGGVDDGTQTVSNQNHCTWWLKMVVSSKMDREVPPPKKKGTPGMASQTDMFSGRVIGCFLHHPASQWLHDMGKQLRHGQARSRITKHPQIEIRGLENVSQMAASTCALPTRTSIYKPFI